MSVAKQAFRLFLDSAEDAASQTPWPYVDLPSNSVSAIAAREKSLHLAPVGEGNLEIGATLEAVQFEGKPYLLLAADPAAGVRVNGAPALPLSVLNVRDQFEIAGQTAHVSLFTQPFIGPAGEALAGKECPICTLEAEAETMVYVCPNCQAVLHAEGEEKPADQRLECAKLTDRCPCCDSELVFEEGCDYVPER